MKVSNLRRREVLTWAYEYNMVVNPVKGFEYYLESYSKFGCCPCDEDRKSCPCPESIEEVEKLGYCKCRLFWRDYAKFAEEMLPANGRP